MEVTYFIIAIIEIILTVYLVFVILKADKNIKEAECALNCTLKMFRFKYKKFAIILSSFNKILKLYSIYTDEIKKYKRVYKAIKNLQNAIFILTFIVGLKNHKNIDFKKLIKLF